jgi:hypothetical protein
MRLRAEIKNRANEACQNLGDEKPPSSAEIEETTEGFFLYRLDLSGQCISDTWHQSLEEAKEQAKFEFLISEHEWLEVSQGSKAR